MRKNKLPSNKYAEDILFEYGKTLNYERLTSRLMNSLFLMSVI